MADKYRIAHDVADFIANSDAGVTLGRQSKKRFDVGNGEKSGSAWLHCMDRFQV
jgi:hypothetical protein